MVLQWKVRQYCNKVLGCLWSLSIRENEIEGEGKLALTLIFYHVSPLVGYSFGSLFGQLWCEDKEPLVLLDHIIHSWPIPSIFWHTWHGKPEFVQPSSIKYLCQAFRGCHVVFNYDGDDLGWVCFEKHLNFLKDINGWLLLENQIEIFPTKWISESFDYVSSKKFARSKRQQTDKELHIKVALTKAV